MDKYPNLEEAMKEKSVTRKNIADVLDVRYATVIDKLKGKSPFRYDEAELIKKTYFPEYQLEILFSTN